MGLINIPMLFRSYPQLKFESSAYNLHLGNDLLFKDLIYTK